jgi:hypothetical protein
MIFLLRSLILLVFVGTAFCGGMAKIGRLEILGVVSQLDAARCSLRRSPTMRPSARHAINRASSAACLSYLLDCEIRLAVEPFVRWEMGDFRVFLRALPAMCALIASGRKA